MLLLSWSRQWGSWGMGQRIPKRELLWGCWEVGLGWPRTPESPLQTRLTKALPAACLLPRALGTRRMVRAVQTLLNCPCSCVSGTREGELRPQTWKVSFLISAKQSGAAGGRPESQDEAFSAFPSLPRSLNPSPSPPPCTQVTKGNRATGQGSPSRRNFKDKVGAGGRVRGGCLVHPDVKGHFCQR